MQNDGKKASTSISCKMRIENLRQTKRPFSESYSILLKTNFRCKIKGSHSNFGAKCRLQNRPSVAVLQLRLLCLFGVNLLISSWCWTSPALKTWTQFIRKYNISLNVDMKWLLESEVVHKSKSQSNARNEAISYLSGRFKVHSMIL